MKFTITRKVIRYIYIFLNVCVIVVFLLWVVAKVADCIDREVCLGEMVEDYQKNTLVPIFGKEEQILEPKIVRIEKFLPEKPKKLEVVEEKKQKYELYNESGVLKYEAGDYEGAVEDFSEAIDIKSDFATAYYNRALAKKMLNKHKEAKMDMEKYEDFK